MLELLGAAEEEVEYMTGGGMYEGMSMLEVGTM